MSRGAGGHWKGVCAHSRADGFLRGHPLTFSTGRRRKLSCLTPAFCEEPQELLEKLPRPWRPCSWPVSLPRLSSSAPALWGIFPQFALQAALQTNCQCIMRFCSRCGSATAPYTVAPRRPPSAGTSLSCGDPLLPLGRMTWALSMFCRPSGCRHCAGRLGPTLPPSYIAQLQACWGPSSY